jgi:hypothetical protein
MICLGYDQKAFIDNLETDDLYCFGLDRDTADLELTKKMEIMIMDSIQYYIN